MKVIDQYKWPVITLLVVITFLCVYNVYDLIEVGEYRSLHGYMITSEHTIAFYSRVIMWAFAGYKCVEKIMSILDSDVEKD